MTVRDHFAAAALTGLLAGKEHNRDIDGADHTATAYYIADAMLRERERRVTEPMPKEKRAEVSDRSKPIATCDTPATQTTPGECSTPREGTFRVSQNAQPTLTDAERKAVKWAAKQMQYINADNAAAILRGLLDRLG